MGSIGQSAVPVSGPETLTEDGTGCLTQGTMAGRASWHLSNQCWNNLGGRMASMYRPVRERGGQRPAWENKARMVGGKMVSRRRLYPDPQSWDHHQLRLRGLPGEDRNQHLGSNREGPASTKPSGHRQRGLWICLQLKEIPRFDHHINCTRTNEGSIVVTTLRAKCISTSHLTYRDCSRI